MTWIRCVPIGSAARANTAERRKVSFPLAPVFGFERCWCLGLRGNLSAICVCVTYGDQNIKSTIDLTIKHNAYVTLDHKTSHKGQFCEIEIYISSGTCINNLSIDVWFVMIGQYLKI